MYECVSDWMEKKKEKEIGRERRLKGDGKKERAPNVIYNGRVSPHRKLIKVHMSNEVSKKLKILLTDFSLVVSSSSVMSAV